MNRIMRWPLRLLAICQLVLAGRVVGRMLRTSRGMRIERPANAASDARVTVIVPVLDEVRRLRPCLQGLGRQGDALHEILVVDGGSTDGTQDLVREMIASDSRIRLIEAPPSPPNWNGKAWNLHVGLSESCRKSTWILGIDADVRVESELITSLVSFAESSELQALSVATRQDLGDLGSGVLHPSMLTTLVYRFGIPGHTYASSDRVQASGQCFLVTRQALEGIGGFETVAMTNSEDVALARELVMNGTTIGFFETDNLVSVKMYENWRDTWQGWSRSLPARDRSRRRSWMQGIAEIVAVQALPLPILLLHKLTRGGSTARLLVLVNVSLAFMRIGVLAGTRRAYISPPWTYWLSPLVDLPVAMKLVVSSFRRSHMWRGRIVVSEE